MPTATDIHPTGTPAAQFPRKTLHVYVAKYLGDVSGPTWDDEALEPRLIPEVYSWGSCGELTTVVLRYELGQSQDGESEEQHVHEVGVRYLHGAKIRLVDDDADPSPEEWFRGYLGFDELLVQASPDRETYQVTAYGPELLLRNKVVSGQWYANVSVDNKELGGSADATDRVRDNAFTSDLPVIFNACRKDTEDAANLAGANASPEVWNLSSESAVDDAGATVFLSPGRKVDGTSVAAVPWTAYRALRSLVEWVDNYQVISYGWTDWTAIQGILGAKVIRTVAVETMNLLEAIEAVLSPMGYGFALEPWANADGKHALLVGSLKEPGQVVHPYLAPAATKMTSVSGKAAEVQRLSFALDSHNIRNDVAVLGDVWRKQVDLYYAADTATNGLAPCWKTDDEKLSDWAWDSSDTTDGIDPLREFPPDPLGVPDWADFHRKYDPKGSEHLSNPHTFRSFTWNEDGSFKTFISTLPDVGTLCGVGFGSGKWARRPRPVGPTFHFDDAGKIKISDPQVWLVEPTTGAKVRLDEVKIWDDYAGFTILQEYCELGPGPTILDLWRPFEKCIEAPAQLALCPFLQLLLNTLTNAGTGYKIEIHLLGSIEDDACVYGHAPRVTGSPWPLVSQKTIRDPSRFHGREVVDDVGGTTDTIDDTTAAEDLAEQIRDAEEDQLGHGSILLPFVTCAYPVLAGVGATAGRVIALNVDGGGALYQPVIRQVRWSLGEGPQTTELVLDSPLLRIGR